MPQTSPPRRLLAALLLGVGVGLFSSRADFLPPETPLHVLVAMGNAIGPWVAVAFLAGAIQGDARRGAVGGAVALMAGVTTYYLAALLFWGHGVPSFLSQLFAVWLVVGLVAGSVTGAAAGGWAVHDRFRWIGPALLAGALLAEAAYRFIEVEGWLGIDLARTGVQVALIDSIAALVVPALLLKRPRWLVAYAGSVAIGAAGLLVIVGVEWVIRTSLG
jgi:hypothetical protein